MSATGFLIQLDSGRPFFPDSIEECGVVYGSEERTLPWHKVRGFINKSHVAHLKFTYQGREYEYFYRYGEWKVQNETPLFHAREMLE